MQCQQLQREWVFKSTKCEAYSKTTSSDSTTTPGPGPTSPTAPASTLSSPPSNNSNTPVIVAAVLAGLGWCIVIGLAVFLLHFRRQSQKEAFTVPSGRARMVHVCEDSNFRRSSGSVVTETRAETRPGPSSERLSGYTSLPPVCTLQTLELRPEMAQFVLFRTSYLLMSRQQQFPASLRSTVIVCRSKIFIYNLDIDAMTQAKERLLFFKRTHPRMRD